MDFWLKEGLTDFGNLKEQELCLAPTHRSPLTYESTYVYI